MSIFSSIFGSKKERDVKKLIPLVEEINKHYTGLSKLSDDELRDKTQQFKQRLNDGETIDDILPEAFAVVKDACRRLVGTTWSAADIPVKWDMVPYDVQLMGAISLHQGKISEMATGEGKTLVAVMPLYLNALEGKGAHLVTVNDYLARRDSEWMGEIFKFLGLTVGVILTQMPPSERRKQYACDITYGTNNEFGFDYLRDNMAISAEDVVQRGHHFAIVDEVDSVLIDEARTPLIIAGPSNVSDSQRFGRLNTAINQLVKRQRDAVNDIVARAERELEENKETEASVSIFIANKGAPKHKRLRNLLEDPHAQKLLLEGEKDYLLKTSTQGGYNMSREDYFRELYFFIDEKEHSITTTEKGDESLAGYLGVKVEDLSPPNLSDSIYEIEQDSLYTPEQKARLRMELEEKFSAISERKHDISQLLRAHTLYEKDVEYVVQEGKVLIVDEFTGRIMYGRRFSEGLHSAIEAKENVRIEPETQTIATITLQNYFRLYKKLAGMTGTAETEETEFWNTYKLEVAVIPTNEPIRRKDYEDYIYKTKREKYKAVIDEIEDCYNRRQPVLVGTVSVDVSEILSRMLQRKGIKHNVLNAKQHQREAEIVAQAGQPGAVTIATNMAGRGTDIKLGEGVVKWEGQRGDKNQAAGGLHIIGTERHESRRIDRQLRGRAGRQGDPGSSRFYLSLEDDLMRLFGSDRIASIMDRMGLQEGEVITHPLVTKSIEAAQKRVEARNFDIRKHLLEYDDVMNSQREVIYKRRYNLLFGEDPEGQIKEVIEDYADYIIEEFTDEKTTPDEWDWNTIEDKLARNMLVSFNIPEDMLNRMTQDDLRERIVNAANANLDFKKQEIGAEMSDKLFRFAPLRIIDTKWKDHLYDMDRIKEGIGLRAYGQKDPLVEYKKEGFNMFMEMLDSINEEVLKIVFRAQIKSAAPERPVSLPRVSLVHQESTNMGLAGIQRQMPQQQSGVDLPASLRPTQNIPRAGKQEPVRNVIPKVGRNEPCPCGSGKKYKQCHGRI